MPKIKKVVATVWYNKESMRKLRNVFPNARFVYVDFYEKNRLAEEVRDADVAILMGDVDPVLLGENTLKWIHCDHAGLNGSARGAGNGNPPGEYLRAGDRKSVV